MRLHGLDGTYCLIVGRWRIRWAGKNFRPLFSERYGYQKWYGIGRLKIRRAKMGPGGIAL